jgi:hypothetical protein
MILEFKIIKIFIINIILYLSGNLDFSKGTENKVIQFAHSSTLYLALCLNIFLGSLPKYNSIFFLLFCISIPISSHEDFGKIKGLEIF